MMITAPLSIGPSLLSCLLSRLRPIQHRYIRTLRFRRSFGALRNPLTCPPEVARALSGQDVGKLQCIKLGRILDAMHKNCIVSKVRIHLERN